MKCRSGASSWCSSTAPRVESDVAADEVAGPDGVLNIGEVLARLEPEFPEATVSKIRFLESRGLLTPGRSASGYRQFTEADVTRLTWILRQQRDHFLPLKVIGALLAEGRDLVEEGVGSGRSFTEEARVRDLGSVSMSREELATATGLEVETVDELERLGLLEGREAGTSVVYDGDALLVARVATRFAEHGFDVRHLRMYLVAAQREAGIIEQVLRPILREGDGRSRAEVRRLVDELSDAGAALHDLLLRRSLGPFG